MKTVLLTGVSGFIGQHLSRAFLKKGWTKFKDSFTVLQPSKYAMSSGASSSSGRVRFIPMAQSSNPIADQKGALACASCSTGISLPQRPPVTISATSQNEMQDECCNSQTPDQSCGDTADTFLRRLFKETLSATLMVAKFMALAFLLEALITLYVPQEWITAALGRHNPLVIITAAILGVPAYTTSLTALPMMGGLLTQGMSPAAALAFLVAGPTTTLPAMAAVWPLVARRVFVLYISFALLGAVLIGYIYYLVDVIFA